MLFNVVNPQSMKKNQVYQENDIVDFQIAFEGKQIVPNSIKVTGEVCVCKSDGSNNISNSAQCYIDTYAGIHSAFAQITCSSDQQGVLETNSQYPLYVAAKTQALLTQTQLASNSTYMPDLKLGNDNLVPVILSRDSSVNGITLNNKTPVSAVVPEAFTSFVMTPDICFNKTSGAIAYSKTGNIVISLRLATNQQFLYGSNAGNFAYFLRNVQLQYKTAPQGKQGGALQMESIYNVRNTLETNNAEVHTSVPAACSSVSCVFHRLSTLNTAADNTLELQVPPNIEEVNFSFNDMNDAYVGYTLKHINEILYNYQDSWGGRGKNSFSLDRLFNEATGFGVGLNFKQLISMTNNSFGLNIKSGIDFDNQYAIFMIFKSIVSI